MLDELHARHLIGVEDVREVWLIRHADAYVGLEGLAEGRVDPRLSDRGREQAQLLADRLAPVGLQSVWTSDLRRARETAQAIARSRQLEVRVDSRLQEVLTHWDQGGSGALGEPGVYPFPEPEADVTARMSAVMADVAADLDSRGTKPARAAVVSHNAAIAIYVSSVLGLKWGQLRVMPQFTSVTVLALKGEQVVVQSIADATHLALADTRPGVPGSVTGD